MKYVFVIVAILAINYSAAFPQHGNRSNDETLIVNERGYNKSANDKYSLLADANQIRDSPGKQEGSDVGFVSIGPLNLTLYELKFEINWEEAKRSCKTAHFGICYDTYSPDGRAGSCSPSQCYLKISMDEQNNIIKSIANWATNLNAGVASFSFPDSSSSSCKPKIQNGMIQLNVKNIACPVKAKDAKIKYPEIPTTTVKPVSTDDTASASIWSKWWFYLIIVFFLILIFLLIGGAILYFYLDSRKKPSDPLRTAKSPAAAATKSTAAAAANTTQKTTEKNTAIEKSSIKKKKTAAAAKTAKNNNTASSIKPSATLAGDTESRKMNLSHADKTMDGVESLAGNVTYEHS